MYHVTNQSHRPRNWRSWRNYLGWTPVYMATYNLLIAYHNFGICRSILLLWASIQSPRKHFQPARHCINTPQSLFNANGTEEYPANVDTPLPAMSVLESKRGKWEIHYSHFQPNGIICTRHFSYLWRRQEAVHCTECYCFTFWRSFSSVCLLAYWKFSCEDYRNSDRPHKSNELLVDW